MTVENDSDSSSTDSNDSDSNDLQVNMDFDATYAELLENPEKRAAVDRVFTDIGVPPVSDWVTNNGTSRRASAQNLEEDAISVLSSVTSNSGGLDGLHGLVSHITKHIATLLDVELRDNIEALERGNKHLNKICKYTVTSALRTDSVIIDHDMKIPV